MLSYNSNGLLSSIQNGNGDVWGIGYSLDTVPSTNVWRVADVAPPVVGSDNSIWQFNGCDYTNKTPSTGLQETFVTDPRGSQPGRCINPNTLTTYTTATFFNYAGLAVEKDGPQVSDNLSGTTTAPKQTWLWDSNDNLICERDPNANANMLGCYATNNQTVLDPGDNLSTLYNYKNFAPYALTSVTYPKANWALGSGTGPARTVSYTYDSAGSFNGLWSKLYTNGQASGVPVYTEAWPWFSFSGAPANMPQGTPYSIVFSGMLQVPSRDTYDFKLSYGSTSDGVLLSVAGQSLLNCFGQTGNGSSDCGKTPSSVNKILYSGPQPITIELSHQVGNQVTFNFQWKKHSASTWNTFSSGGGSPDVTPDLSILNVQETNSGGTGQPDVKQTWGYSSTACVNPDNTPDFAITRQLPCQTSVIDVNTGETRTTAYHYYASTGLLDTKILPSPSGGSSPPPMYHYVYADPNDPACASTIIYYDARYDPSTGFSTQQTCDVTEPHPSVHLL